MKYVSDCTMATVTSMFKIKTTPLGYHACRALFNQSDCVDGKLIFKAFYRHSRDLTHAHTHIRCDTWSSCRSPEAHWRSWWCWWSRTGSGWSRSCCCLWLLFPQQKHHLQHNSAQTTWNNFMLLLTLTRHGKSRFCIFNPDHSSACKQARIYLFWLFMVLEYVIKHVMIPIPFK